MEYESGFSPSVGEATAGADFHAGCRRLSSQSVWCDFSACVSFEIGVGAQLSLKGREVLGIMEPLRESVFAAAAGEAKSMKQ